METFTEISRLAQQKCIPCEGNARPLEGNALEERLAELGGGWKLVDNHHLEKEYKFPDFRQALDFTNRAGELAEAENHHPDIFLSWGKVKLVLWTHKVDGLTDNDFIVAAKADRLQS